MAKLLPFVSPAADPIEHRLGCCGFFGFGGGYVQGRRDRHGRKPVDANAIYCNTRCSMGQACWEAHRERCRELFPALMADLERLAGIYKHGPLIVQRFQERHGELPPDVTVMLGNIADGMAVGLGHAVQDRGAATLPYPFKVEGGA